MVDHAKIGQQLSALRNLHIASERDTEFQSHIERLLKRDEAGAIIPDPVRFTQTGETRGILVLDEPGGGKTTLVERGLRKLPALAQGPYGEPRYIASVVPNPATFKSMALSLLEVTGYPAVSPQREAWSMWQIVRKRMTELGITVLWIDEAHDLFCADRNVILRGLKTLMQGDDALIVILSGTMKLGEIIRTDPQVQRRFSTLILPPVSEEEDRDMFASVISTYCEKVGLMPPDAPDLVGRLFRASRSRFGRAVETVIGAIERALLEGADTLELEHFAEYWAIQEGCTVEMNVFHVDDWWDVPVDKPAAELAPKPKRGRKKAA